MLNFGDKCCRIIHGEKTTFRVINILTKKYDEKKIENIK